MSDTHDGKCPKWVESYKGGRGVRWYKVFLFGLGFLANPTVFLKDLTHQFQRNMYVEIKITSNYKDPINKYSPFASNFSVMTLWCILYSLSHLLYNMLRSITGPVDEGPSGKLRFAPFLTKGLWGNIIKVSKK